MVVHCYGERGAPLAASVRRPRWVLLARLRDLLSRPSRWGSELIVHWRMAQEALPRAPLCEEERVLRQSPVAPPFAALGR